MARLHFISESKISNEYKYFKKICESVFRICFTGSNPTFVYKFSIYCVKILSRNFARDHQVCFLYLSEIPFFNFKRLLKHENDYSLSFAGQEYPGLVHVRPSRLLQFVANIIKLWSNIQFIRQLSYAEVQAKIVTTRFINFGDPHESKSITRRGHYCGQGLKELYFYFKQAF